MTRLNIVPVVDAGQNPSATAVLGAQRDLVSSRVFPASRELVFRGFTEAEHLARWWGPNGFTSTFQEFDPQPGGVWRFIMHGPDGRNYQNRHIYTEVIKPSKLVLQHVSGPLFQLTINLTEESGGTRVTWHMLFESAEECAKISKYAVPANEENFDRLGAELEQMARGQSSRPRT